MGSWNKLVCYVVLLVKIKQNWVKNKRKSNNKEDLSRLSPDEIQNANMVLCRVAQLQSYPEENNQQKHDKTNHKNLSLLPFRLVIHESLIQVGGHMKHTELLCNINHQIIIHFKQQIASLILRGMHERYMHTEQHHILSISREHYWTSKGCSLARKIVPSCSTCKPRVVKPASLLMTNIPTKRTSIKQQLSTHTGVNYLDPTYV